MLILSRKAGQSVMIGDSIIVAVVDIHRHQVRMQVHAPSGVAVIQDDDAHHGIRVGQSLKIGDSILVTVLRIYGSLVRLGIAAPRDVAVHRDEIYRRISSGVPLAPAAPISKG